MVTINTATLIPAAQYSMRTSSATYGDGNLLPYQNLIYQPPDGSIQMMDRTLKIDKDGNYLFNMTLATNGTSNIPNIHLIVNDANGRRDIDLVNVMPQGMTSGSVVIPIKGPATAFYQVQGANASVTVPGNQPQGQLTIVKIA
jgi:hypothetical protein